MITRMGLLRKRPGMSDEAFRDHWRVSHGPLAAQLPGLRRYHQNRVIDREQRAISYTRGGFEFDGFSELWFDDLPSMSAAFASGLDRKLASDEA